MGSDNKEEALSPVKRKLLEMLLAKQKAEKDASRRHDAIRPRESNGPAPLSFSQQRLWFLDRLDPGNPIYNIPFGFRFRAELDVPLLTRVLKEIAKRHEQLRTVFETIDGEPVQVVHEDLFPTLESHDFADYEETEQKEALDALLREHALQAFDLQRGPLWHMTVVRLAPADFAILFTMHHIIADAWSFRVLAKELAVLSQAFLEGRPSPLPPPVIQYADFAVWQRDQLDAAGIKNEINYWRKHLEGIPPLLELPLDKPRPAVQSYRGDQTPLHFDAALEQKLRGYAREKATTPFVVLQAALAHLLSRYSGQTDVVLGAPVTNRQQEETEALIGFFVNTLVLRTDLSDNPDFESLTARVDQTTRTAQEHGLLPFERLVEALQPERNLAHAPLFQAMFSYNHVPTGEAGADGAALLESLSVPHVTAKLDFTMAIEDHGDKLSGAIQFCSDLFTKQSMARMADHFTRLLDQALQQPKRRLAAVVLISPEERGKLIHDFNDVPKHWEDEGFRSLSLFETLAHNQPHACALVMARQRPDAPHLTAHSHTLSYAELNARANQLAAYLRSRGAVPDRPVGLYLHRETYLIEALLACFKAGCGYIPLAPAYPVERIRFMIADAGLDLVLVDHKTHALTENTDALPINLQEAADEISRQSPENTSRSADVKNLANIIYTSGSTGQPKGVAVPFEGLDNFVMCLKYAMQVKPDERVLQFAPLNFDAAGAEVFSALCWGGSLHMSDQDTFLETQSFMGFMQSQMITRACMPPSVWNSLLRPEELPHLKVVVTGGEACARQMVNRWSPGRLFINVYGPTETSIGCTRAVCRESDRIPPIGRPFPGTKAFVCDQYLNPTPIGIPGELCIGGPGVTRGYQNKPQLTATVYVPDPFADKPGRRLYKTGDRVRFLDNGELVFMGRMDQQIKLRGFRIEPGEIEDLLMTHPNVTKAVVTLQQNPVKRLVAYVLPNQLETGIDTRELREFARATLPENMVPVVYVTLAKLPTLPSGKINRRALPPPPEDGPQKDTDYHGPVGKTEEALAEIWCDLLGLKQVDRKAGFFELGGHSLLATRLLTRIRKTFHVDIPLQDLFKAETLQSQATIIKNRGQQKNDGTPPLRPFAKQGRTIPLSFAQERLWILNRIDPNSPYYNMPMAMVMAGDLSTRALTIALEDLSRRHHILRTTFRESAGVAEQVIHEDLTFSLTQHDLSHENEAAQWERAESMITQDALKPFDLTNGPLWRVSLIKLAEQRYIILFNMHHIISDGWSMSVATRDFAAFYRAAKGLGIPPDPLPIQYADYSLWQAEWFRAGGLARQEAYWLEQLDQAPAGIDLVYDFPRPARQSFQGGAVEFRIERQRVFALRQLGRRHGATLFMSLLAVFKILLFRYSGQRDLVLGTPIANRNQHELEDLIGFFVNTLVLRSRANPKLNFEQWLEQIRDMTTAAFSNQDIPFNNLVERLQPERSSTYNPLFNIMFALQNLPEADLDLGDTTIRPLSTNAQSAKFELSLTFVELPSGELVGSWVYSSDLFARASIQGMSRHFENLLKLVVTEPERPIGSHALADRSEAHLLRQWNQTERPYPREKTVHGVFEEMAAARPEAIALVCADEQLSYAELNRRADHLAQRLLTLGIHDEEPVAVCIQRSNAMIIALLGILKAGGYYVGIDAKSPPGRIRRIFAGSRIRLVLTNADWDTPIPDLPHELIDVGADPPGGTEKPEPHSRPRFSRGLAYVSYTSGSTGKPKGVAITHRGVLRLVKDVDYVKLGPDDAMLQFATLAFDASTFEIWGMLLNGGRLVIMTPRQPSLAEYGAMIISRRLTSLFPTPSFFNLILDHHADDLRDLHQIAAGGDTASVPHIRKALAELPNCRLLNCYGPTETTTLASTHLIQEDPHKSVPIGKALPNTRLYVVNQGWELAAIGVPGELCVAGDGLARGYQNEPALTAASFPPNPFGKLMGDRVYRTGDRVRFLPNGNLEFLGRVDDQVKIRGFRIEPGEIQTVLENHEAVDEALVLIRDEAGEKRLLAYAVLHPYASLSEASPEKDTHQQLDTWKDLFDSQPYHEAETDPTMNVTGWESSYTGEPIPREQMLVWLDDTIAKIRFTKPRQVLEVGCGTGMILFRVAPDCSNYYATDIAPAALAFVNNHLKRPELKDCHVELMERRADQLDDLPEGVFDTVILNSVVQYFPSPAYLERTLESLTRRLGESGVLFLGDIRNHDLLVHLKLDVALTQSPASTSLLKLKRLVRAAVEEDNELLVSPAWFHSLVERYERVSHVEVLLKQGEAVNELNLFRYDVRIWLGEVEQQAVNWRSSSQEHDVAWIRETLIQSQPDHLALAGVLNSRLSDKQAALTILSGEHELQTVGDLRKALPEQNQGIDPQALWDLGAELGYEVRIYDAGLDKPDAYDVLFIRNGSDKLFAQSPVTRFRRDITLDALANRPMHGLQKRRFQPILRTYLEANLPEYMVPDDFMILDSFPMTNTGKIDRRALPEPKREREDAFIAPRYAAEELMAGIWQKVLGMDRLSVTDNFFALGGHSLLATRVVAAIRDVFHIELPLRRLFEAPTLAELTTLVSRIQTQQAGLEAPLLKPREQTNDVPLSYAQQRLWFLQNVNPNSVQYNEPMVIRLDPATDLGLLQRTIDHIVARHESLRTTLPTRSGEPVQHIHPPGPVPIHIEELDGADLSDAQLKQQLQREAVRPFDLAKGPLFRVYLFKLGTGQLVLMLNMHHIITDGWSLGVLGAEVAAIYTAFNQDREPDLPELTIQYPDYAVWQRSWLVGEALEKRLNYWREHLAAPLPVLSLPEDFPRPAIQSERGEALDLMIPRELTAALRRLSENQGTTLYMTLLAGLSVLLRAYSGQNDLVVGCPIANRNRSETEGLIGFFINSLALRIQTADEAGRSFQQLLTQVREVTLDGYAHQDVPFETVVEAVAPKRDMSRHPVFQIIFGLVNTPGVSGTASSMEPESTSAAIPIHTGAAKYDLGLNLRETPNGIAIRWEYCTDLFRRESILRMERHYRNILTAVAADPSLALAAIPIASQEERHNVLVNWNATEWTYPSGTFLHSRFEVWADSEPNNLALSLVGDGASGLNYAALNRWAETLALRLQSVGIGPDRIVAIHAPKCVEAIVGQLAVLKAGGAFMVIDPEAPEARSQMMLQEANPTAILTVGEAGAIGAFAGIPIIPIQADETHLKPKPIVTDPANLAYVIFTSGSTGRPKGVAVTHASIVNLCADRCRALDITPSDRAAQITRLTFDAAIYEVWPFLSQGASSHLIPYHVVTDPVQLHQTLLDARITITFTPTPLAETLITFSWPPTTPLRIMLIGGDQLRVYPPTDLPFKPHNNYGPTETTVITSSYDISDVRPDTLPPIGKPIDNQRLYIVNEALRELPPGIPGELMIGGVGLSRGYLGRPELTAAVFVPNPFGETPGERLYRSGDRARFLSEGNIAFMGRIDRQVQLRGMRIELGEIEAVLLKLESVVSVAVLLRDDLDGDPRLVAYLEMDANENATAEQLREAMADHLPEYMIPSNFVVLPALPLNASGKVDRRALPKPSDTEQVFTEPRDATEEQLAAIWTEVLKLEKVSVHDNFFEVGGHSLLATQIVSRIRDVLGAALPVRVLFEAPTIARLAQRLKQETGADPGDAAPPIQPRDPNQPAPLSFTQQRLWFMDRLEDSKSAYNMPTPLGFEGPFDFRALFRCAREILSRHEILRTNYMELDGEPRTKVQANPEFRPALIDLTGLPETEREGLATRLLIQESRKPFDLERDLMLRVNLVRVSNAYHLLLCTMHHIASDGWSSGVLVRELAALYTAFLNEDPSPLPELKIQYSDFAAWQVDWVSGGVLQAQLDYWRDMLAAPLPVLPLPMDFTYQPGRDAEGAAERIRLNAESLQRLSALANAEDASLFMVLVTAFSTLLHRLTGETDIIVGAPIAGRTRSELEDLIGCFLNMLALRSHPSAELPFRDYLRNLRRVTLDAYAHQDLPFERLVEAIQPQRNLERHPIFDVQLNFINTPGGELNLPGLRLRSAGGSEALEAKFAMNLYITDTGVGLDLRLVYKKNRFAAERMRCLLTQYRFLLEQVGQNADRSLLAYSLLAPETTAPLPNADTPLDRPIFETVPQLFERWCERLPEAEAVRFQGTVHSYADLQRRTHSIAAELKRRGIQAGEVVAVIQPRGFDLIASMLGVLTIGGVMLVIDPKLPELRAGQMINIAKARLALTHGEQSFPLAGIGSHQVETLTDSEKTILPHSTPPAPEDSAYIYFTSGTTGAPKGILGAHQGLSHFLAWLRDFTGLAPGDRGPQILGLSFDASLREIFGPLSAGATLSLSTDNLLADSSAFWRWLEDEDPALLHTVPSLLQHLLEGAPANLELNNMRWVFCAGEPLTDRLVNQWRRCFPGKAEVVNLYGPTEVSMTKLYYRVPTVPAPGVQPIGAAMPQTLTLVRNAQGEPCGIGEPGEIIIRTHFRTRGYLNGGPADQRRFVGETDFHTGDLGRIRHDGNLEFLGRSDKQVKILGVRVEPEEIERLLMQHETVEQAAVIALPNPKGQLGLAAFVVGADQTPQFEGIRAWLRTHLPEAMVPTRYITLKAIPLTVGGKRDARALAALAEAYTEQQVEKVPPRDGTEEMLLTIWREVLGVVDMGIHDDFFALGGHSLLAIRVISAIRQSFHTEIPLRTLFEAPTIALLAQAITRSRNSAHRADVPPLIPRDPQADVPLSYAQQRLWLLHQLNPESAQYHDPLVIPLPQAVDLETVQRTIDTIANRHEALRTTFHQEGREPVQHIHAPGPVPINRHDLSEMGDTELRAMLRREAVRPFDLSKGPLFRVSLFQTAKRLVLMLTMHHIITDGWSRTVIMAEVRECYSAFAEGRDPALKPLPIQYPDFAVWQRGWLQGEALEKRLAYWSEQLAAPLPVLDLPTDFPRPPITSPAGAELDLPLSAELVSSLEELARQEGATLFMVLLSGFNLLMYLYSGQDDIVLGCPHANRDRLELEGLIGFFVNTLAIRTRFLEDDSRPIPTFGRLLAHVRETTLDAYAHQDVPFEAVVERVTRERDMSRAPVFQVMFGMVNTPDLSGGGAPTGGGRAPGDMVVHTETTKFDLSLNMRQAGGGLFMRWEYATDLFERETIALMERRYRDLLTDLAPESRLSEISLLAESEKELILNQWNDTDHPYTNLEPLHVLVARQAAHTPDAVALGDFNGVQFTYRGLDQAAVPLAAKLLEQGVHPRDNVAVMGGREAAVILAMYAILKVGGAFVVIDPEAPEQRTALMLEEVKPAAVLMGTAGKLPPQANHIPRVDLELDFDQTECGLAPENEPRMHLSDLAYLVFTSGSTGRPKGIATQHRAVVNLCHWQRRALALTSRDRASLVARLTFDASTYELWPYWFVGASVHLADDAVIREPDHFQHFLLSRGVTVNFTPTPLAEALLQRQWPEQTALRMMLIGADRLRIYPPDDLPFTIQNNYGPTETTVITSTYTFDGSRPDTLPPIGRPLDNTRLYIVNRGFHLLPPGVPGELVIAGEGLARGYFERPELTAAAFVPNPFSGADSARAGTRLYRTGDKVRFLKDGNIAFMGRLDRQVELRGMRIEPGEIEAVLLKLDAVASAAVLLRHDLDGEPRLVAYLQLKPNENTNADQLREQTARHLPEYMIPANFVILSALPLTASGKVDRAALPKPDDTEKVFTPPRDATEEQLAGIWAEVLKLEKVGVHDNFFEIGGHSLLATQIVSRIRDLLGVTLPVRVLFEAPTIARLAQRLNLGGDDTAGPAAPIQPRDPNRRAPLSFTQQRLWFMDRLETSKSIYNMPTPLGFDGPFDYRALCRCAQEILRRHEILRTNYREVDGEPTTIVQTSPNFEPALIDLAGLPESIREAHSTALLIQDTRTPFDLERDLMLRVNLVRVSNDYHLLLCNMHHIASDGWSSGILVRELAALYTAYLNDKPSPLPALQIQYSDFAAWQVDWVSGEVLQAQLDYWRDMLAAPLPVLPLPSDFAYQPGRDAEGAAERFHLAQECLQRLNALAKAEDASLFMVLVTAFKTLLHRLTGETDIIVGAPIAGRTRSELEDLIGCFLNMLALRSHPSAEMPFREYLRDLRRVTLDAYAHQDLPFEKLVEEVQPERNLERHPIFDVQLNFINTPGGELSLPGLRLRSAGTAERLEAKFAMTLFVTETRTGLDLRLVYKKGRFAAQRMRCLLAQYRFLLEQIGWDADRNLLSYSLLAPETTAPLPNGDTPLERPIFETVPQLFERWRQRQPEAEALRHAGAVLSYADLQRRAHAVAAELKRQGLQAGDVVAIASPRGFELVAAMLGVLTAGGVMLVIDPDLPELRAKQMVGIAKARLALTHGEQSPALTGTTMLDLKTIADQDLTPSAPPAPEQAAYIYFTSGTTGDPKGILGTHQGLSHFLAWLRDFTGLAPGDRGPQILGLSFDASLREVFGPITSGATVSLSSDKLLADSAAFWRWLEAEDPALLHMVPSLLQHLLEGVPDNVRLTSMRWVFCAGEALTDRLVNQWRGCFEGRGAIVNLYGQTEVSMAKQHYVVPAVPIPGAQPVGMPMPHTLTLVRNVLGEPCGIGEPGEIIFRTHFRTRGYLNGGPADIQRFVGETDYHTGDLGRFRFDGNLDYLGRRDKQVKILGVRVEPEEIEQLLTRHERVDKAAVIALPDPKGQLTLAAFLVGSGFDAEQAQPFAEIRAWLRTHLPDAMVPARYFALKEIPLTVGGKRDERALAAIAREQADQKIDKIPPRDGTEEMLLTIWHEVLGAAEIGIHDDFFALGGHSLLATRVISAIRQNFHTEIPLRTLFEAPTIALLAQTVTKARNAGYLADVPPLRPRDPDAEVPLSFAQQRLWLLHQLNPESAQYHDPLVIPLPQTVDLETIQRTIDTIANRHEALRTTFRQEGGQPIQHIHAPGSVPINRHDLRGVDDKELRAMLRREATRPFDLSEGPLFRVSLFQTTERLVLMLTMHHIITDGWSRFVLMNEVRQCYTAFAEGREPELNPLPIQYPDFSVWQRGWLQGEALEKRLAYWSEQLAAPLPVLDLPTDYARPPVTSPAGAELDLPLSAELVSRLEELARQEGATLFMVLLAGFNLLMHLYSGQDDIVLGCPHANRDRQELEGLIGFFVNTLAIRTRFLEDDRVPIPTFRRLLVRVRETTLDAYAHQDVPFEAVVERVTRERDMSRTPVFQVMFGMVNTPDLGGGGKPTATAPSPGDMAVHTGTAKFDLSLNMRQAGGELYIRWEYATDLFERETIALMENRFRILLTELTPESRLEDISLLAEAEKEQILTHWNDTAQAYSNRGALHVLVARQAAQAPDAVALGDFTGSMLTYRELDRAAEHLAATLVERGARPRDNVAVMCRRGIPIIVAMQAVLKAGCAFAAIDPEAPEERTALMFEEAKPAMVLMGADSLLPAQAAHIPCIELNTAAARESGESIPFNEPMVHLADLAYLIFTSGSTGRPKGIAAAHGSVVNLCDNQRASLGLTAWDRASLTAKFTFDASTFELWPYLPVGASVHLADDAETREPDRYQNFLLSRRITVNFTPTPLAEPMLQRKWPARTALRMMLIGGDQLRIYPPKDLPFTIQNNYGPTETTVIASTYTFDGARPDTLPPIGRPLHNTRLYVVNSGLRLLPPGIPGELVVAGDGLARGYFERPELTAAVFVPDPFNGSNSKRPGARLYRTGDKVRFLKDGNIAFLGRLDRQVELRGMRIEPGEIEAVLMGFPMVTNAAVVLQEETPGNPRLVAFIQARMDEGATVMEVGDIRKMLAKRLPEYMIPSTFQIMTHLPTNASGKVDRNALPKPTAASSRPYTAPRNDLEQYLADLWAVILTCDRVGIHDNFFELGGHSLLATQIVSRIRQQYELDIPLRLFFESPTVAALAEQLHNLIVLRNLQDQDQEIEGETEEFEL